MGSFKVTENGADQWIIYDFILVCHCQQSFILYHFPDIWRSKYRDLEILVKGHSRSLKIVPFESLGKVFYLPSIATVAVSLAVSEICSIK